MTYYMDARAGELTEQLGAATRALVEEVKLRDAICGTVFMLLAAVLAGIGWLIMHETGNPWGFTIMVILKFYNCSDNKDSG